MDMIVDNNCTALYQSSNRSCADSLLNMTTTNNETVPDNGEVIRHMFPVSLMKSFVIAMNSVFLPIVVVVGLIGNSLTIYVFRQKKKKTSTTLLLISLAVADLMCICMQIIYLLVQNRNHHFQNVLPNFFVNGFFMTRAIFYFDGISRCIKVEIVLERCLAVYLPFKARLICTPKRALIIVVAVFVCVPLCSIPELMHIDVQGGKASWSTYQMAVQAVKDNKLIFGWYGNLFQLMFGITALMINLVCNIAIAVGFSRSSKSLSRITDSADLRREEKQRKITRMLLKMSMFYVVTCLPKDIGALILLSDRTGTIVFKGNYYFQSVLLFGLSASFLNNSVNFIIYGSSLSKFYQVCCCQRENDHSLSPRQETTRKCTEKSTISISSYETTPLDTPPNGSVESDPHHNHI
ncbi:somatostatin receptor type 5-like [Argopecten irradians]|uniref:somatostatin receptor type 5-like n=1 Tax=Argopecten irradians TaxID=31199 RepID=UPI003719865D